MEFDERFVPDREASLFLPPWPELNGGPWAGV